MKRVIVFGVLNTSSSQHLRVAGLMRQISAKELLVRLNSAVDGCNLTPVDNLPYRSLSDGIADQTGNAEWIGDPSVVSLALCTMASCSRSLQLKPEERLQFDTRNTLEEALPGVIPKLSTSDVMSTFCALVRLRLGSTDDLSRLCELSCRQSIFSHASTSLRVETLSSITVCAKRNMINAKPDCSRMISTLASAKIPPQQAVAVLDAMLTLRLSGCFETVSASCNAIQNGVDALHANQLVLILRASAGLDGMQDALVEKVIRRLQVKSSTLSSRDIGDICKAITNLSERPSLKARLMPAIRRLLPQLVDRTATLTDFSMRDAKNCLECFQSFGVQHGLVFSRLLSKAVR